MTIGELAEAFKRMVEAGHGDLELRVVGGTGWEKPLCGWELVTVTSSLEGQSSRLRLFTDSPF